MHSSLSSINQNLFCLSDFFMVPTSPDYFSVMAINSLSNILPKWETWAKMARVAFNDSSYPFPNASTKFLGTVVQNFTIRNGEPTQAFQRWIDEVANSVTTLLITAITPQGMMLPTNKYIANQVQSGYCLAEIPSFTGLIPRSQQGSMPVYEVPDSMLGVGTVLEQYRIIRDRFQTVFENLADDVENMTN